VRESSGGIGSAQLIDDRAALAAILVDLGHLDEARAVLVGIIAQREALTRADPFEVAVALHNLGSLEFRSGLVTEARQTFERTLALKQATLPPGHPDLAITCTIWRVAWSGLVNPRPPRTTCDAVSTSWHPSSRTIIQPWPRCFANSSGSVSVSATSLELGVAFGRLASEQGTGMPADALPGVHGGGHGP
jgi:hypothetical protein